MATVPQATPALEAAGLGRRFGGIHAVSGVDLRVEVGARHGIIGPNGAGKTTLFNLLSGDLSLSSGSVRIFGQDVSSLSSFRRSKLGVGRTYQISRTFGGLSIRESIALGAVAALERRFSIVKRWQGDAEIAEIVASVAERVGLTPRLDDAASELSHGELRQLELGVALAAGPRLLLLDEPAAGLSTSERRSMAAMLGELPRDLTVVMVEHDMDIVRDVVEDVTVMHHGEILTSGHMADVERDPEVLRVYLGEE